MAHRKKTSTSRAKCATMPAGSTGPCASLRSCNWLAKQPMARRLRAATGRGSGTRIAACQGTRGSPGHAQCHIHTGYHSVPLPPRVARAARPATS